MSDIDQVPVPTERETTLSTPLPSKKVWSKTTLRALIALGLVLYAAVSYFSYLWFGAIGNAFSGIAAPIHILQLSLFTFAFAGGGIWVLYVALILLAGILGVGLVVFSLVKMRGTPLLKPTVVVVAIALLAIHVPQIALSNKHNIEQGKVAQKYVDSYIEVFSHADPQLFGGNFPVQTKMKFLSTLHLDYSQELEDGINAALEVVNPGNEYRSPYLSFASDGSHFCIYTNPKNQADPSGVSAYQGAKTAIEKCKAASEIGDEFDEGQYGPDPFKNYVVVGEADFQQAGPYKYSVDSNADFDLTGMAYYRPTTNGRNQFAFTLNAFHSDYPGRAPRMPITSLRFDFSYQAPIDGLDIIAPKGWKGVTETEQDYDGNTVLKSITFTVDSAEYGVKPKESLSGFQFTVPEKNNIVYYTSNDLNDGTVYEYAQAVGVNSSGKEVEFNFELKKAQ
ncbi:hypothetical protein BH11PAT4_BH11PAT4_6610 [soil metagenome]